MPGDGTILVCGATGLLGSRITTRLVEGGAAVRALVRPPTDAAALERMGVDVHRGDFRDPASLGAAVDGVETIVSTVNTIGRRLTGERSLSMREVDDHGYAALIAAAESAGVGRFVYLSLGGPALAARTPFTDAKRATEARLRASAMREVIVRPDAFQEIWLTEAVQFDWRGGKVTIFGRGNARQAYVAVDDVAQAVVALARMADPPSSVTLGGPEALTRIEAADAFAAALGRDVQRTHVPRVVMRIGSVLLRPLRPELASTMGMSLVTDSGDSGVDDSDFRMLGIDAKPVSAFIRECVQAGAPSTPEAG